MKRILPLFTFILLSVIWCFTTKSQTTINVGGINYNIIDSINNYVEVAPTCNSVIDIPSEITYSGINYSVIRIGDSAFNDCTNLTKVIIPESVTSMGGYVFNNNPNLDSIICYAKNPPIIYDYTFYDNYNMNNVILSVPCLSINSYQNNLYLIDNFAGISTHFVFYDTICSGSTYDRHGIVITNNYMERVIDTMVQTDYGCIYSATIYLSLYPKYQNDYYYYVCHPNDIHYTEHGFNVHMQNPPSFPLEFTINNTSINGCDSNSYLHIIALQDTTYLYGDVCQDSVYKRSPFTLPATPVYTKKPVGTILERTMNIGASSSGNITYQQGCTGSVQKLQVKIQPNVTDTLTVELCNNKTYTWCKEGYKYPGGYKDSIRAIYTSNNQYPVNYRNNNNYYWSSHYHSSNKIIRGDTLSVGEHIFADTTYKTKYGCRNDKYLKITINPIKFDTIRETICWNELPYNRYNFNIGKSEDLNTDTLIVKQNKSETYNGCDSVVHLQLTIKPTKSVTIRDSICFGSDYHANDFDVEGDTVQAFQGTTKTITKINHGQTYLGCDSTTTLYLVFINNKVRNINEQICYGSVYNQNNFSINSSDYNNEYQIIKDTNNNLSHLGCDSTTILSLTITPTYNQTFTDTICYGSSYNQHGFNISFNSYKRTTNYNSNWDTIQYSKTKNLYTKTYNCDSTVTLNLLIQPKFDTTIYANICLDGSYNEWGFNLRGDELGIGTFNRQRLLHRVTGCDSIINLQLTVSALLETDISASVCYGETYNLNGFNINTNDSTERNTSFYIKDSLHLQTVAGCDSTVRLSLRVDPIFEQSISMTICDNETFDFNGRILNTAGNYDTTLQTINGCDSVIHLTLNVNPTKNTRIDTAIIQNNTYTFGSRQLNTAGIYVDSLRTYLGCDSVVTLNLVVWENQTTTFNESICKGDTFTSYNFDQTQGFICDTAGRYVQHLSTTQGADSTVILNLVVFPTYDTTITESICWGQRYTENNFNILSSDSIENPINNMGIINSVLKLQTINGCDSIVHLQLNVNPTKSTRIDTSVCEGFVSNDFYGFEVNTIGMHDGRIYTDTRTVPTLAGGCDSVVSLYIQVNPVYNDIYNEEICYQETYIGHGFNIPTDTSANIEHTITFIHRDTTIFGCDSTTTLHLTIHKKDTTYIEHTLCYGEEYTDNGFNIHTGDSVPLESVRTIYDTLRLQSQYSCDSVVCLTLNVNPTRNTQLYTTLCEGESYTENGFNVNSTGIHRDTTFSVTRTVQTIGNVGCDSTVVLNVTVHPVYNDTILRSICFGETYSDYGFNVASTDYNNEEQVLYFTNSERSFWDCDSLMTLALTIHPVYDTTITENICWGQTYSENNFFINTTDYENITTERVITERIDSVSVYGCDSIINLTLTIYPVRDSIIDTTLLQGESYTINGFNVHTDTVTMNQHWTFTQNIQTLVGGCDSVVTLNVQVWANDITEFIDSICDNEIYEANNFDRQNNYICDTTGTYIQRLQNIHGADSTVYLHLTVMPTYDTTITENICWGQTYSENNFNILTSDSVANPKNTMANISSTLYLQSIYGCDSIVHLNLNVYPIYDTSITIEICDNETFNFNNRIVSVAGNYDTTLQTISGCDSVVHLSLIVHPTFDTTIIDSICFGATYTLNNFNESQAGSYTQSLQSQYGCDSIVHLELKVMNFNDTIEMHLCDGQSYDFHGRILSESGFYRDTLKSIWQCDSIINIDLTVHPNYNDTIYDTICSNFAYNLYNFHIDSAEYLPDTTNYRTQNLQSIWGCDSIVTLALWVWPTYEIHIEKEICEGGHYTDHGYELYFVTQDTTKVVSSFVSSHGCDSIFVLNLYVRPTYDTTIFANICRGETFTMESYDFNCTESGVYKDTLRSAYSCDSIKTINLTVHDHYEVSITDSICLGGIYQRDGFYCTAPGIYKDTLQTFWGCDSIRTLFLWPKPSYNISVDTSICSGSDYYFGDRLLTYSGQYIDTFSTVGGCDSIVTLYLTINAPYADSIEASICEGEVYDLHGFYATETGRYIDTFTTVGGCDSIRILNLHVKPSYHDTIEQTICSGEIFSELGFHADRPGYYTHSGNTYLGCDSTIILHLNVNDKIFDTLNIEICEGEEYRENNFNENSTGIYDRHLETSYGCDSIVTLNLTVNKVYDDTISAVIKEGNTFDLYNFYEDQDGVYSQYLTSSKGCDSTVTLVLEIDRDAKLFIPNAFTPLDRYNNTFCVYPQEEIVHLKSFKIFNRWGTLLWQTDDITQCWNGIYEGKFVPQGVYVYKVEYYRDTEPNEILEEKGTVMVLY